MGWLVKSGCLGWGYSGRLRLRVLRGRRVWEPVSVSVPAQRQRQRQVQKRIQGALRFGREDGELGRGIAFGISLNQRCHFLS
jgi:Ni,Fe-hydrogenase III component G